MIDVQAIYVIWLREMKRFFRDKSQILIGSVRPVTWLFFMGYGLGPSFHGAPGTGYTQFVLPGITIMALQRQIVPPTTNLDDPDPACDLNYIANEPQAAKLEVALSNSFGFGGTNGALIFRRWRE